MNKYIRIKLIDDRAYLIYERGLIFEMVGMYSRWGVGIVGRSIPLTLVDRLGILKRRIQNARANARDVDTLADKPKGSVLGLIKQKRGRIAELAFKGKAPTSASRHIGVEIEFISPSDRVEIAYTLAERNLTQYVELKEDGSLRCDGSCRDECECANCDETHYCSSDEECGRRERTYRQGELWVIRESCLECNDADACEGHCPGHGCMWADDHPDYGCNCECNCSSEYGHEIAVVAQSSKIAEVVTAVCRVLKQHRARVNDSCGLHVHLDMRSSNAKRAFHNLVNSQRLLYSMVPSSRYENQYCRPNQVGKAMRTYQGRYWGINPSSYKKHKTIEIRLHSGTVQAEKILHWVALLRLIAYSKTRIPVVGSFAEFKTLKRVPVQLCDYIVSRIGQFARNHGGYSLPISNLLTQHEDLEVRRTQSTEIRPVFQETDAWRELRSLCNNLISGRESA